MVLHRWRSRIAFDTPKDQGGTQEQQTPPNHGSAPTVVLPPEVLNALKSGAEKNGGFQEFATVLYNENKQLRDRNATLERGQVPEGAVILKGEDADAWNRLKADGGFKAVLAKLEEGQTAKQKLASLEREKSVLAAASALGWNGEALWHVVKDDDSLSLVVEGSPSGEGEAQKVYVAKKDGDNLTRTLAEEYAEKHWKPVLPALKATKEQPNASSTQTFPRQKPSANGQPKKVLTVDERADKKRKSRKYAL